MGGGSKKKADKFSFQEVVDQQELSAVVSKLKSAPKAKDGLVKLFKVRARPRER